MINRVLAGVRHIHHQIDDIDGRIRAFDTELRSSRHPLELTLKAAEQVIAEADSKVKAAVAPVSETEVLVDAVPIKRGINIVDCPSCKREQKVEPKTGAAKVTDEQQRARTLRHIVGEMAEMETHLQEGGRIEGTVCDCILKHSASLEVLSKEMVNFGGGPEYHKLRDWAAEMYRRFSTEKIVQMDVGHPEFLKALAEARAMRKGLK